MPLNLEMKSSRKPAGRETKRGGFRLPVVLSAVAALALLIGAGRYAREKGFFVPLASKEKTACAQEARQCPDGKTSVSRTGPNCEFTECSVLNETTKENEIPLFAGLEWSPRRSEFDPYHGEWDGYSVHSSEVKADIQANFFEFYDAQLKLRGWAEDQIQGDSPLASLSGYRKGDKHIMLMVERESLQTNLDPPFSCPCNFVYSIWSDANLTFN